jgi:hypothetical protein
MKLTANVMLIYAMLMARLGATEPSATIRNSISSPIVVGEFLADERTDFNRGSGLPDMHVRCVSADGNGRVFAGTPQGLVRFANGIPTVVAKDIDVTAVDALETEVWFTSNDGLYRFDDGGIKLIARLPSSAGRPIRVNDIAISRGTVWLAATDGLWRRKDERLSIVDPLNSRLGGDRSVRSIDVCADGRAAVAAAGGAWIETNRGGWQPLFPHDQYRSWAPRDVRGVAFDSLGRLWIASPQGVAVQNGDEGWTLYAAEDGLPFNDFTAVAADGEQMWFGTVRGAIRFDGREWRTRMAPRWLPSDVVLDVAVDDHHDAWFATPNGLGVIRQVPMTLSQKAERFEQQIDRYHRRTEYAYVDAVTLDRSGDLSQWSQHDSDNDGLWTSMYGAGECFAYAATGNERSRERAWAAFEAVRFLSQVTQGGSHPARPGFPARSILPASGPDPNQFHTAERDRQEQLSDPLWKVIVPRWPKSADGKWYWKCDTSSDELDGHYFLYACCYDLVARTDDERRRVREVVVSITDHLIENQYELIDHDGRPTRWARFGPHVLNGGIMPEERGLNSLSILSYLKVARHMTGDEKYQKAYEDLIQNHSYAINTLHPKDHAGPGTGNQSDDEMAFMSYYNLLNYETDAKLRGIYLRSLQDYWRLEQPEHCPLFNFIWAVFDPSQTAATDRPYLQAGVETLRRFPLDLIQWRFDHRHRLDIVRMPFSGLQGRQRGYRRDGQVIPVDERSVNHWNHDPWTLWADHDGRTLADGAAFLLPYYMGRYHGILQ